MTTGIQTFDSTSDEIVVRLVENIGTAQGVPPDGAAGDVLTARPTSTQFFNFAFLKQEYANLTGKPFEWPDDSWIEVYETAGSGTMTIASLRVWTYSTASKKAFPPGPGADATKGMLNSAAALGETGANQIRHKELLLYPMHGDGIQIEFGAIGGTSPTFNADWHIPLKR